jgi:hypothetical protein
MKPLTIASIVAVLVVLGGIAYFTFATSPTPSPTPETPSSETQSEKPQGKLDINAVCQGALAYMTFSDGASADAFVAGCKEGNHPEVIERFKADMNLGDGAAI